MSRNQISRFERNLRSLVAVALALSIPVAALAQTQLGTVTSSSPFELRGANINPAPGVPSWPVVSGDTVQAGKSPLALTLPDGRTVIFAPGTRVTLSVMSNGLMVRLESGSVQNALLRDPSGIDFYCKDEKISITSAITNCGRPPQAEWWPAVGGAAGATAMVLALNNGPPVSPARCGGVGLPACP